MESSEDDSRASTQLAEPAWIGRTIDDRYRITGLLGEGGMGAVYTAEHIKLNKPVALKVIRPELAGIGDVAARFAREAMAVARFEHPHVAGAIDYGTFPEGGAFLVMQLVQGNSLGSIIEQEGALDWRRMCAIGAQVADALAAAKAQGIIHRDLKPDNVMIEPRDDGSELVKILDFGIARITAKEDNENANNAVNRELTRVGTVVGTPGYMAPEQAIGDAIDHRVDMYALGVLMWEGLTGEALWDGDDLTSIVTRQLREEPPSVAERLGAKDLPAELDALISDLLARRVQARPEHPGEVRDALRRLSYSAGGGSPRGSAMARQLVALGGPSASSAGRVLKGAADRGLVVAKEAARGLTQRWQRLQRAQRMYLAIAGVVVIAAAGAGMAMGTETEATQTEASKSDKRVSGGLLALVSPQAVPEAKPKVPDEVQEALDTMLERRPLVERRQAAQTILDYEPASQVPSHIQLMARLEASRTCKGRNEILEEMIKAEDPRVLPVVERLHRAPKKGCGFLNLSDCYSCLRPRLAAAMAKLKPLDESD